MEPYLDQFIAFLEASNQFIQKGSVQNSQILGQRFGQAFPPVNQIPGNRPRTVVMLIDRMEDYRTEYGHKKMDKFPFFIFKSIEYRNYLQSLPGAGYSRFSRP